MNFKETDRYRYFELGIWGPTYKRWLKEGLKEEELKGDWFRGQPKFAHLEFNAGLDIWVRCATISI